MKIRIGDKYIIKSDTYNVWIEKIVNYKKKDGTPAVRNDRVTGYFGDFKLCMVDFIQKVAKSAEATEVTDILKAIDEAVKDAVQIILEAYKSGKAGEVGEGH